MVVQVALHNFSRHLDILATKANVQLMRDEVKRLTETLIEKVEKLEGQLFDTEVKTDKLESEVKTDKLESEVKSLKKGNETITNIVKQQD